MLLSVNSTTGFILIKSNFIELNFSVEMSQPKPFSSAWFISVLVQLSISISTLSAHKRKALTQMDLMMRYGQGKSIMIY